MAQETLEIIRGLAQAAANGYDGATDEEGKRINIGLKRDEGNPITDSRVMDGFKIKIDGSFCLINYQSDINISEIYKNDYENELERTMSEIVKFLKKEYKKITGKALTLTSEGDVNALVQKTSNIRYFVNATKKYKIGGIKDVDDRLSDPHGNKTGYYGNKLEKDFESFIKQGGWGSRPKNKNQKAPKG